jgi:ketosteroid isomerase-like protein
MTTREQAVVTAALDRARALVNGDRARLMEMHHPLLRWTTYDGRVLSRDAYVAGNTADDLTWIDQSLTDIDVQVIDDTIAVLTAVATDIVERDGCRQSFRLRLTQCWVATDAGWRCVAGHAGPQLGDGRSTLPQTPRPVLK